jgi:hypothetical protein
LSNIFSYDTREKAQEGVEITLSIGDETVMGYDDKPVLWRIKGMADPEVAKAVLAVGRAGMSRTLEEMTDLEMKLVRAALTGWSDNLAAGDDEDGKPILVPYSRENREKVCGIPDLRKALIGEIGKSSHFTNKG